MRVGKHTQFGFTIVELLIVVVVIAILAAITIVSFNGIQARAQQTAVAGELNQNSKTIASAVAMGAANYLPSSVMSQGLSATKFDASKYKVITYCANTTNYVLLAETTNGRKFYSRDGAAMVENSALNSYQPCPGLGVGSSQTTYLNLPSQCASEGSACSFAGPATIVYGSVSQGRFTSQANVTSPITCNNINFGDPAPTFGKACYVYPN